IPRHNKVPIIYLSCEVKSGRYIGTLVQIILINILRHLDKCRNIRRMSFQSLLRVFSQERL
ncbi:MAG TPA: hypothetical protein VHG34_00980, partial [Nitrososphaeraceae archaeon]|nr:hypothetical protein [Nitrososphaeraceae archaeon]